MECEGEVSVKGRGGKERGGDEKVEARRCKKSSTGKEGAAPREPYRASESNTIWLCRITSTSDPADPRGQALEGDLHVRRCGCVFM